MDDENINLLLDAFAQKKKQAENIAQMLAMEFVEKNNQETRMKSLQYLHDAELWREAGELVRKHRVKIK